MTSIPIPLVNRDTRIGSVFNHLFKITNATDNAVGDAVELDFSGTTFFHPFFLAPLSVYLQGCDKRVILKNCPKAMERYLDLICFDRPFEYFRDPIKDNTLDVYATKTYTPVCSFAANDTDASSRLQEHLQEIIRRQTEYDDALRMPLSYLLGELVCNIEQHSCASKGYIFAQYLKSEGCIDVCIADDGRTVFSSYVRAGKYLNEIGNSEAQALLKANNGFSTKNSEERGYGLRTSHKMLTEGLGGAFFMLSGNAFMRVADGHTDAIDLPKELRWNGTIVLLRIPVSVRRGFDFYRYLE